MTPSHLAAQVQRLAQQLEDSTPDPVLLHCIRAFSILGQHSSSWVRSVVWKALDHLDQYKAPEETS